jgi:hypothetical protein
MRHNHQSALKDIDLIQNLRVVFPQNDISIILVLVGDIIVAGIIAPIVAMAMVTEMAMVMVVMVMATVEMVVATVVATVAVVMEEVENENSSTVP